MKKSYIAIFVVVIIFIWIIGYSSLGIKNDIGSNTEYKCNVKHLNLATTIEINKENEYFAKVTGNIFTFITDPLTMIDSDGNKVAYAGDEYHFIAQDSHSVFVDGEVTAEMVGKVEFFGEEYDIYDKDGKKIASVKFNESNTDGEMYDTNGNLIADYNSKLGFYDFDVRITDKCTIDEKTVLMIFCSYYSDQSADSN